MKTRSITIRKEITDSQIKVFLGEAPDWFEKDLDDQILHLLEYGVCASSGSKHQMDELFHPLTTGLAKCSVPFSIKDTPWTRDWDGIKDGIFRSLRISIQKDLAN